MILEDFSIKELLGTISLKERTTGQETFNSFYSFVKELNLPLLLTTQNHPIDSAKWDTAYSI